MRKILGICLTGILVVALAAVAVAQETPSPAPGEKQGEGRRRPAAGRGFRVIHGDGVAIKADGSTVEVRTQKGTVDEVDADSITLTSPDGYKQTYTIDGETVIRKERAESKAAELKAGNAVRVMAVKSGNGYTARRIHSAGEPGARLKALQERAKAQ